MSKFQKRITKIAKNHPTDALVIGTAFGHLEDLITMYNTVFVFSKSSVDIKAPNLIIRKELESCFNLISISAIYIDLEYIKALEYMSPLLSSCSAEIFVEGNEVIPKDRSTNIRRHRYQALAQGGEFHYWSKVG